MKTAWIPGAALALASVLSNCTPATGAGADSPDVKSEPGSVELILNDPTGRPAPLDKCDVRLCTSLVETLDKAKESIDFAIYGMRDQTAVLDALKRAKARGVRVRGVVDRDVKGKNYYSSTEELVAAIGDVKSDVEADRKVAEAEAAKDFDYKPKCKGPPGFKGPVQCLAYPLEDNTCLVAAHASREALNNEGAIMHNKFFVVDRRWVWTGSTNVSNSGTGGYNANLVTLVDNPTVARWYTEEFEQMFVEGRYHNFKKARLDKVVRVGDATLEVLFSPQEIPIRAAVRRLLRSAEKKIDIAVFFLTHKGIANDLIRAHQRGVRIRVIMDSTAAKNGYAKHELLRAIGIPVKIESWGGKMHMKSAAIDGKHVITGSMNWTTAGQATNDENTIVIESPRLAKQYHAFFDKIWTSLGDQWLKGRPDPESKDSGNACADNSDNDFDHKRDAEDPGCGDDPPPMPPMPGWRIVPMRENSCDVDDPATIRSSEPRGGSPKPEPGSGDTGGSDAAAGEAPAEPVPNEETP